MRLNCNTEICSCCSCAPSAAEASKTAKTSHAAATAFAVVAWKNQLIGLKVTQSLDLFGDSDSYIYGFVKEGFDDAGVIVINKKTDHTRGIDTYGHAACEIASKACQDGIRQIVQVNEVFRYRESVHRAVGVI